MQIGNCVGKRHHLTSITFHLGRAYLRAHVSGDFREWRRTFNATHS
jgi:hypothetical protein